MPSIISTISYQYKKRTNARNDLKKQLSSLSHGSLHQMTPPEIMKRKHRIQADACFGRPVYYMNFEKAGELPCVLYLHGGAFLTGLQKKHWRFISSVLSGSGYPMAVADYPLIPENTHRQILAFCLETYKTLLSRCPHGIILMGDSAGANLCMVLAQQAERKGLAKPNKLLLLSPFLDATGSNSIKTVLTPRDPVLETDSIREAALLYAGSRSLEDPLISPVFGSMEVLPEVIIWTGDNDILYADALLLKERLKEARAPYHMYTYPCMVHDWMLDLLPESRTALRQIIRTIQER